MGKPVRLVPHTMAFPPDLALFQSKAFEEQILRPHSPCFAACDCEKILT